MSQSPPALLVRLREADVVRFCGLDAAARGMELAARNAVAAARREDARLLATVQDGQPRHVWADVSADTAAPRLRWQCDHEALDDARTTESGLACAHVAALLTAWIRRPTDFTAPAAERPADAVEIRLPVERAAQPQMTQPALLRARVTRPPRRGTSLVDELERLSAADLTAVTRRVLAAEPPEHEVRELLAAALRDPKLVAALVGRIDPAARALLGDILLLGGTVTAADLDGMAARGQRAAGALRAEMAVLERHALVFPAPAAGIPPLGVGERGWRQVTGWRVPPELRAILPVTLPFAPGASRTSGRSVPDTAVSPRPARVVRAAPQRLCLALALLSRAPQPFNPLAAGDAATSRRADASAVTASPGRAPFPLAPGDLRPAALADCARSAGMPQGLAQMARRVLLWARESGADYPLHDLARTPAAELPLALRAGFRVWRDAEAAAELADLSLPGAAVRAGFDSTHPALRPAALAAEVQEARQFLLRLLDAAQPGLWYALDDLLDLLWRLRPLFLRGRQQAYTTPAWWLERPGDGKPLRPTVHDEWLAAEGAYTCALLAGPLHWWGILDLALEPGGQAAAMRVTPLGRFLLDRGNALPSKEAEIMVAGPWGAPALVTRSGALAVHPLAAGAELLDALAEWARPTAIAGGRLICTLAADLACAAWDRGTTADALLAHLRRVDAASGTRVAPVVEQRLVGWHLSYGLTRIEEGWTLLEAQDEAALVEALAHVPEVAAHARRLGPALALVASADAGALVAALTKRGYSL
jgi:hypothetical protein